MITASEAYDIMEKAAYTEEELLNYLSNLITRAARNGKDGCSIDIEALQSYVDRGFDFTHIMSLLFTYGYESQVRDNAWFVISWKNPKW